MLLAIKFTGTTKGFEHYYGEVISNGKVVTEYYTRVRRGIPNLYITRQEFPGYKTETPWYGQKITATNLPLFCKRIVEALKCQSK